MRSWVAVKHPTPDSPWHTALDDDGASPADYAAAASPSPPPRHLPVSLPQTLNLKPSLAAMPCRQTTGARAAPCLMGSVTGRRAWRSLLTSWPGRCFERCAGLWAPPSGVHTPGTPGYRPTRKDARPGALQLHGKIGLGAAPGPRGALSG